MPPHTWQLLAENDDARRHDGSAASAGHLAPHHGRRPGVEAGVPGTGARHALATSATVLAAGHADTAAAALEEAFDAAEMHILTAAPAPFVLLWDGQELRLIPSPSVDLSLAMLAGLRDELHAELPEAGR